MKIYFYLLLFFFSGCTFNGQEPIFNKSESALFCPEKMGFTKENGEGFSSLEESRAYISRLLQKRKEHAESFGYDEDAILKPLLERINADICVSFFGSPASPTLVDEYRSKGINIRQCEMEPKRFVNIYDLKEAKSNGSYLLYVNWPLSASAYLLECSNGVCSIVEESMCWIR